MTSGAPAVPGRPGCGRSAPVARVLDAEVLGPGRPGIVDVVAELGERFVHVPFGLRSPGEETRFIPDGDDAVLGSFVDDDGAAVVFDATRDAVVAAMLLERVSGEAVETALGAPSARRRGLGHPGHGGPHRLHRVQRGRRRPAPRPRALPGARRGGLQPPGRTVGGVAPGRA